MNTASQYWGEIGNYCFIARHRWGASHPVRQESCSRAGTRVWCHLCHDILPPSWQLDKAVE